jgi:hypothetical protein
MVGKVLIEPDVHVFSFEDRGPLFVAGFYFVIEEISYLGTVHLFVRTIGADC